MCRTFSKSRRSDEAKRALGRPCHRGSAQELGVPDAIRFVLEWQMPQESGLTTNVEGCSDVRAGRPNGVERGVVIHTRTPASRGAETRRTAADRGSVNTDPTSAESLWVIVDETAIASHAVDGARSCVTCLVEGRTFLQGRTENRDGDRARQRKGWPAGNTDVPASRKVADAIRHMSGSKPRGAEGE